MKPKWKLCKKCGAGTWTLYSGKYLCSKCQNVRKERKKPFRLNEIQRANIELEIKILTATIKTLNEMDSSGVSV